jgi:DNA mismatch endonuclease (patch repair protein)
MTDVVDAITRSRMMSGIRGKNTKPEKLVRSLLHRQGFRFRLHVSNLPGKPDIVLPRYNAVIFVHGCFWHRHACRYFKWPQTRPDFWREKIARNCSNDLKSRRALKKEGWRIGIVWECAVRGAGKDTENITYRIGEWLHGDKSSMEIRG